MTQAKVDRVVYRWPRARLVRPLGFAIVVLGVTWLVVLGILGVAGHSDAPGPYVVLLVLSLVVACVAGGLLAWPPAVLELDSAGYRLRHLRGGGQQSARWSDVASLSTEDSATGPVLVFHGTGDHRSVVPLTLLGARAEEVLAEVRLRLNAAYGYRPL